MIFFLLSDMLITNRYQSRFAVRTHRFRPSHVVDLFVAVSRSDLNIFGAAHFDVPCNLFAGSQDSLVPNVGNIHKPLCRLVRLEKTI